MHRQDFGVAPQSRNLSRGKTLSPMCLLSGFCADQILGRPFLGMVFTHVQTANRVNVRVSAADLRARRIC